MKRKLIIAGNWKMCKTIGDAIELTTGLKRELFSFNWQTVDVVVCPAFTALAEVAEVIAETGIGLGAQNCHWEKEGAFTGEVSCPMIKDTGATFVIIGHSERRQFFGETNESVNKKTNAALANGLTPIVCVGETLAEREANKTFAVLEKQLTDGFAGIVAQEMARVIVAYEPVWAIGTGKTATSVGAQEAHQFIRGVLSKLFTVETAQEVRIQYGGSVKPENAADLMKQPDIDGALVGGASLKVDSFVAIVKNSSVVVK
jgi:triosephosphate isomerase (TIM)